MKTQKKPGRNPANIYTPFTPAQVKSLNEYQQSPLHPYTCGRDSEHPPLLATRSGWRCVYPGCKYRQEWAHRPMADMQWENYLLSNLPYIMGQDQGEEEGPVSVTVSGEGRL